MEAKLRRDFHPTRCFELCFFMLEHGDGALDPVPVPVDHLLEDLVIVLVLDLPAGMDMADGEPTDLQLLTKGCGVHGVKGRSLPQEPLSRM